MATVKEVFDIQGMSCSACEHSVSTVLKQIDGIVSSDVYCLSAEATITYDPTVFSLSSTNEKLTSLGYGIAEKSLNSDEIQKENFPLKNIIGCAVFAIPLFILGMVFHSMNLYVAIISALLATIILVFYGRTIIVFGVRKLLSLTPTMDSLIAIGAIISFLQSCFAVGLAVINQHHHHISTYFETSGIIIFFVLIGKHLEERGKKSSANALQSLLQTTNELIEVQRNGVKLQCYQNEIVIGDLVRIKPGEKIPVDGMIERGESYVDEQIFTGETTFPFKQTGSQVLAGSINQNGTFILKATRSTKESYIQAMRKFVQHSLHSKASIESITDKISRYFVPSIFLVSFSVFLIWYSQGLSIELSLQFAINVLVIACPCALGLATPMAVIAGFSLASRNGILIREASVFEQLAIINTIVFDKTGTLTYGKLQLKDSIYLSNELSKEELLTTVVAIQKKSEHPIASSFVQEFSSYTDETIEVANFEAIRGNGVSANINKINWKIGTLKFVSNQHTSSKLSQDFHNFIEQNALRTVVFVSVDNLVVAAFAFDDTIRKGAKEVIAALKATSIHPILCSGDSKKVVESIANEVGISQFYGRFLPVDKAMIIDELQKNSFVAYMGDGINDSIATAKSTISIAPKNASEAIKELSSVLFQKDSLSSLLDLFSISKKVRYKIYGNLAFAFGFNVVSIPIAAGLLYNSFHISLNPMIASAAMAMSSLFVVGNTLLLLRK
jgi:heavy metal translocating P-type ATPase